MSCFTWKLATVRDAHYEREGISLQKVEDAAAALTSTHLLVVLPPLLRHLLLRLLPLLLQLLLLTLVLLLSPWQQRHETQCRHLHRLQVDARA